GLDSDVTLAINFPAVQFQDKTFPDFLEQVLRSSSLPPGRIELEITETALLNETATTQDMLDRFRSIGVGVSLDDFGTGYSSLSHLRTFPFSKIKIDG